MCDVVVDVILGCASWFGELQCGEDFAVIVREREFSEKFECMQLPKAHLEPLVELNVVCRLCAGRVCFKCVGSFRFFPVFCGSGLIQLRPERRQNICDLIKLLLRICVEENFTSRLHNHMWITCST